LEIDDQKALDIMAGRAAAGLFGGAAAKHGKELFGHYLSFKLAGTPGDTISELRLSPQETLALLKRNKMAAEKASAALAALWEDVKNAKKHNKKFMSDFAYPFFIEMLRVVNAAKLCSDINLGEFQARDCVKNGNVTKALGIIKETEALLAAGRREYERIAAETKDEPGLKDYIKDYDKLMEKSYKHRNGSGLLNPDFKSLESRLSNLRENYPDIYAKHNISCDFKKWFASREITARKMKSPAAPDGYPDGGDWKNAPPLEYFASGDFVLSPEPLFLRFLYDDKNLYINGKVFSAEDSSAGGPLDIFITRADKTAPEVYRLSVGAGGELTCGVKKSFAEDAPFQSWRSGAKAAVTKDKDGWAFKIAAPLEELAPADSRGKTFCKVNYTRKSDDKGADAEVYSSAVSGGKKSGPPEGYSKLVFAPEASAPNPSVTIELDENKTGISTRAHETGVGSLVTFNFGVRTDRVLRNAVISGSITDDKGGTLATVQTIEKPLAQSLWTNDEPCQIQLDDTHDNIRIRLRLEAETLEGEKTEKTKVFKVGHEKPNPENSLPLPGVWKCAPDPGDKGRGKAWFAPGFDDRSWKKVSILKSLEKQGIKDYTYAWYRTSSVIPEKYKNKKVYLMLGAVDDTCWVWINGRAAGEYLYDPVNRPHSWREPLYFDISGLVDFGGDNQITALVRKKDGQHGGIWSASYLLFED
jgi:hypothetical protein